MLIVSECFSSIHTNLYSLLDTGSNTGNRCPRASRGGESAYGRSGALRAFVAHVYSYGRVPCFQSSVFRAVFAFGFAALRKLG